MIYGFDLGDGESAIARMSTGVPEVLSLGGEKSLVTALAVMEDGSMYIGESACQQQANARSLHVRFKQRFLSGNIQAHESVERFARAVYLQLRSDGYLTDEQEARFLVGCPSGWDKEARERYRTLFERAGFVGAAVTPESRAAFLSARESGVLAATQAQMVKPTLIIDAGSSTTDFTVVTRFQVTDSGQVNLGAGLIDQALLQMNLTRSRESRELSGQLESYPQYRAYCELLARRVKEALFNAQLRGILHEEIPCASSIKLYTLPGHPSLDISCTDKEMERILHAPMDELDGQNYVSAYEEALRQVKMQHADELPELILLTGGASRMGFMRSICEKMFPNAKILQGSEPEFAIARGLCYALHLDEQTQGFKEEAQRVISREVIEQQTLDALPDLYARCAPILVDVLIKQVAPSVFAAWRNGDIRTLEAMQAELEGACTAYLTPELLQTLLEQESELWMNGLRVGLEEITTKLCEQFGLPSTALRMPQDAALSVDATGFAMGSQLIDLSYAKLISDVVIATASATLCGGGGIALAVGGPIGLIVGAAAGVLLSRGLMGVTEKLLWKSDVPKFVRRAFTQNAFEKSLEKKRDDMCKELLGGMLARLDPPDKRTQRMLASVAGAVSDQMQENLEQALVLLK